MNITKDQCTKNSQAIKDFVTGKLEKMQEQQQSDRHDLKEKIQVVRDVTMDGIDTLKDKITEGFERLKDEMGEVKLELNTNNVNTASLQKDFNDHNRKLDKMVTNKVFFTLLGIFLTISASCLAYAIGRTEHLAERTSVVSDRIANIEVDIAEIKTVLGMSGIEHK